MPALWSKVAPLVRFPTIWSVFKRHGHARILQRTDQQTIWKRVKDHTHFYFLIGIVFWGGIVAYYDTRYGMCQLVDTPEGYEPRFWEYERHPVVQKMCWWMNFNMQQMYEERLGILDNSKRRKMWTREEERARHLMYERQDYKGWYYVPYSNKWIEFSYWQFEGYKRRFPAWFQQPS